MAQVKVIISGGFSTAYRQVLQMFCAAVVKGSNEVEASKQLIAFLSSERATAANRKYGMEPAGK